MPDDGIAPRNGDRGCMTPRDIFVARPATPPADLRRVDLDRMSRPAHHLRTRRDAPGVGILGSGLSDSGPKRATFVVVPRGVKSSAIAGFACDSSWLDRHFAG